MPICNINQLICLDRINDLIQVKDAKRKIGRPKRTWTKLVGKYMISLWNSERSNWQKQFFCVIADKNNFFFFIADKNLRPVEMSLRKITKIIASKLTPRRHLFDRKNDNKLTTFFLCYERLIKKMLHFHITSFALLK